MSLADARGPTSTALREDGVALVVALLAVLLVLALAGGLVLATSVESGISWRYQISEEMLYAADAAAARAMLDLVRVGDFNDVLGGATLSTMIDGPPGGTRTLADGSVLDLAAVVNMANCEQPTPCSAADMDAVTERRPWGRNNPRWQMYGFGPLKDLLPSSSGAGSAAYVVVLVGDDPFETDGDPGRDGTGPSPGAGVVALRAEAFGPRGAHRVVEWTVARTPPGVRSWREVP